MDSRAHDFKPLGYVLRTVSRIVSHFSVLRHPSLVKFQGIFTASDGRLVLVTEPVSPLLTIIESMTVEEITAGQCSMLSSLMMENGNY